MSGNSNKIYRTLWRWHFYAGLFCIPFIVSLSITGAIFLFKPQINAWVDRDFQHLDISGTRSTPAQQIAAVKESLPNASFASYRLPEHDRQAVVITFNEKGQNIFSYVDPYTLEILKRVAKDSQFIRIVRTLHGELMLGNTGSIVIELAGCWAIVLIVTGLYLWWPRSSTGLAGVLYPRLFKGGRQFWRDLHAVTGFWVAFFTLFLLVSGLPWALVWGSAFKEIRSLGKPAVQQDWHVAHQHASSSGSDISMTLTAELLDKAALLELSPPVEMAPDRNNPHQWKLASGHQNRTLRADAWFSAEDGELVKVADFSERQLVDRVIGIGISAHEGHLFGWLNQLLGLLVTLGLMLVSVSGFILWRKRKPDGVLGAPPVMRNNTVSQVVLAITLLLSILLPVLAVSLVLIWIIERFIISRIQVARTWLGLA